MATLQNAAALALPLARRDSRDGGALDSQTEQAIAALNDRVLAALLERLAAAAAAGLLPAAPAMRAGRGVPRAARVVAGAMAGAGATGGMEGARPGEGAAVAAAADAGAGAVEPAPARRPVPSLSLPPALLQLGHAWLALDLPARRVLVTAPYLLVEIDFEVLLPGLAAGTREPGAGGVRGVDAELPAGDAGARAWREIARLAFQYSWHLAQSAPTLAAFAIGTRQAAVQALRALDVVRADALALAAGPHVALRWADDAPFWAEWLAAARGVDPAALWACRRRGLQRIAGECRAALSP